MTRNLYRIYLYTVFMAMLIFAAVGLGILLQTLLSLTSLRGVYGATPSYASIVQATVFFAVSWLIAALFGILHYWLIRHDMHNDPEASRSAIRSFFLNTTELLDAPLAIVVTATAVIPQLGRDPAFDLTGSAAFGVSTLLLLAVLELERQRTQVGSGAALAFQRLHLYGVQLILLIALTFFWFNTVSQLTDAFIFNGRVTGTIACIGFTGCSSPNLLSLMVSTLWIVVFWIGYGYFTCNESSSLIRKILRFASFAFGVGLILFGISRAIELGILSLFSVFLAASEILNSYNFTALISLGLLIAGVYMFWLRIAAGKGSAELEWASTTLICEAIITILFAAAFWWGIALILVNVFQILNGIHTGARNWAPALALIVTGLAYIPLDLNLHQRYKQDARHASDPRRGYIFALIAGGILSAAIGGAVALYSLGTKLLGSSIENWHQIARAGTSAFVVGVLLLGLYLWIARSEKLFSGLVKRPVSKEAPPKIEPVPTFSLPMQLDPVEILPIIEGLLDDLLAGKIYRDEAAKQIQNIICQSEIVK